MIYDMRQHKPVRTLRELWRLDVCQFRSGYALAVHGMRIAEPSHVSTAYFTGWLHGASAVGIIANHPDVCAVNADKELNCALSDLVH